MILRSLTVCFIVLVCSGISPAFAAKIEADPSKNYELTNNRGPWMISVATFHTTDPKGETKSGKTPEEAAQELVLELRKLGMPAYVYLHEPETSKVVVKDRIGREEVRKNLHRVRTVLVLAGNYQDINDKLAQDSLKWVKRINPECLQQGVNFTPTQGRPTPLSGAFLTINPLLSPDEVARNTRDPLLVKLNAGENNSLTENQGQYSLVIARFHGKQSVIHTKFKDLNDDVDLDDAGRAAQELVTVLRGKYDKTGQFNNLDAYIWHDRYGSMVTVGSFASEHDPAIDRYKKLFGSQLVTFDNGRQSYQPGHFGVEGFGKNRDELRVWAFEPNPQLMQVPRLR